MMSTKKDKPHGLTGKANASKGKEEWKRTTVQLDPKKVAELEKHGIKIVDAIDWGLEMVIREHDNNAQ